MLSIVRSLTVNLWHDYTMDTACHPLLSKLYLVGFSNARGNKIDMCCYFPPYFDNISFSTNTASVLGASLEAPPVLLLTSARNRYIPTYISLLSLIPHFRVRSLYRQFVMKTCIFSWRSFQYNIFFSQWLTQNWSWIDTC